MQPLRALLHRHRLLAMLLLACALVVKAAVPAGYMIERHGATATIELCPDASVGMIKQIAHALPGQSMTGKSMTGKSMDGMGGHGMGGHDMGGHDMGGHDGGGHDKMAAPCPYAALGLAPLASADGVLLALALVFILAVGLAAVPSVPLRRISFLRPPLRGPPARA